MELIWGPESLDRGVQGFRSRGSGSVAGPRGGARNWTTRDQGTTKPQPQSMSQQAARQSTSAVRLAVQTVKNFCTSWKTVSAPTSLPQVSPVPKTPPPIRSPQGPLRLNAWGGGGGQNPPPARSSLCWTAQ